MTGRAGDSIDVARRPGVEGLGRTPMDRHRLDLCDLPCHRVPNEGVAEPVPAR